MFELDKLCTMISNSFTSGFINHTNITGCFSCKRINQLRTNNINICIENANTLTPRPITTQQAIIFGIESTIKSIDTIRHSPIGNT